MSIRWRQRHLPGPVFLSLHAHSWSQNRTTWGTAATGILSRVKYTLATPGYTLEWAASAWKSCTTCPTSFCTREPCLLCYVLRLSFLSALPQLEMCDCEQRASCITSLECCVSVWGSWGKGPAILLHKRSHAHTTRLSVLLSCDHISTVSHHFGVHFCDVTMFKSELFCTAVSKFMLKKWHESFVFFLMFGFFFRSLCPRHIFSHGRQLFVVQSMQLTGC